MASVCLFQITLYSLLCVCLFQLAYGSKIVLEATPDDVKEGLTSTLTLTCWLNDTDASAAVVGRRDVTQTTDNMAAVSSLIVMKDGTDVASVSQANPAHVMDGSANVGVSGSVTRVKGENGFLQLTFQDPTSKQSGEYSCEANAVGTSGHIVTFSTTIAVTLSTPSIADIVAHVRQKDTENGDLEKRVEAIEKSMTKVFFSVGLDGSLDTIRDQVILFDHIFSNIGDAFDISNGLFTCKIAGHYEFVYTISNVNEKQFYTHLQLNNQNIISIWGPGGPGNHDQGSNSVIVQLAKGDVVRVVAHAHSHITSSLDQMSITFTGNLLKTD